MEKQEGIKELAVKLSKLVEVFRENKPARESEFWVVTTSVTMFKAQYGYQDSQPLYGEVIQDILNLNPEMLSENEVHDKVIYHFIIPQIHWDIEPGYLYGQELENHAVEFISELVEFEKWQNIDIPIVNLWPDKEQVTIGEVTFLPITKQEIEQWKNKMNYPVLPMLIDNVKVVARVNSPGDSSKALSYAIDNVILVLNLLRAFCFPFGKKSNMWPVGILGDINISRQIPIRINNREYPIRIGPGIYNNRLREHILTNLTPKQVELIEKLIKNSNRSNMEKKLFDSTHWLAEATKPDTNNAKFAKISFALETLIGGETSDSVRGITAMLAERAAFIAGKDFDDRWTIDKNIRKYYGMRSNIVHGSKGEVSLQNIDEFGNLVRRLALALLEKLDKLGDKIDNVEKLENWVKLQRYTLPKDTNKEGS